jgi:hypothetical protein
MTALEQAREYISRHTDSYNRSEIITFSARKVKVEPADADAATAYHAAEHAAERSGEASDSLIVENRADFMSSLL